MAILDVVKNWFKPNITKRSGNFLDPSSFMSAGSGVPVNQDTALGFTAVWAAIRILSESVAQLPINVIEREENGDKIKRSDHFLYSMIHNKPNEYMTNFTFIQKIMYDLCVAGNSYVKIERNGSGRPIALYPILNEDIEIKEYEEKLYYSNRNTGETLEYEEILHFKIMSQDGMVGQSPIDTCSQSISWGLALESYGNAYFNNGAKVSGVLQTDRALSIEAIDRLRGFKIYNN